MKRVLLVVVSRIISVVPVSTGVVAGSAFLDRALASDSDVGAGLIVHVSETLAAGSKDLADEVDSGEVFDRDVNFVNKKGLLEAVKVLRVLVARNSCRSSTDKRSTFLFQLLAVAMLAGVDAAACGVVFGRWRRRSC